MDCLENQGAEKKGRSERNKQDKLVRITEAACRLFAERGISEVTTQQVAEAADVATGTLFLYAKTKGELLLLAQNAGYSIALDVGKRDSQNATGAIDAVMKLWRPIIVCNRKHVENGRAYLREVVFGDGQESNQRMALSLMNETELATSKLIESQSNSSEEIAKVQAKVITALIFLLLSNPLNVTKNVSQLASEVAEQVSLILKE